MFGCEQIHELRFGQTWLAHRKCVQALPHIRSTLRQSCGKNSFQENHSCCQRSPSRGPAATKAEEDTKAYYRPMGILLGASFFGGTLRGR